MLPKLRQQVHIAFLKIMLVFCVKSGATRGKRPARTGYKHNGRSNRSGAPTAFRKPGLLCLSLTLTEPSVTVMAMAPAPNGAAHAKTADITTATAMVSLTADGIKIATVIWTKLGIATAMAGSTAALTGMTTSALIAVMTGTGMVN